MTPVSPAEMPDPVLRALYCWHEARRKQAARAAERHERHALIVRLWVELRGQEEPDAAGAIAERLGVSRRTVWRVVAGGC